MSIDKPLLLPIKKIVQETPRVKSFLFEIPAAEEDSCCCDCCVSTHSLRGKPGQVAMVWIPGHEEIPLGIIHRNEHDLLIAVAAVGEGTEALHAMKKGNLVGFRGPYGKPYTPPKKGQTIALVAGGYGMAPLSYLAQEAKKNGVAVHLFAGARNKEELLYAKWMKDIGVVAHIATDDGSDGYKGFVPSLFNKEIGGLHPDRVYVTGPEIMEYKIAQTCWAKKIPFEVSLERYFKCAIGICGMCCVDPTGDRMCVEGPVVDGEKLKEITEFGKYYRTPSGAVRPFPWAGAK